MKTSSVIVLWLCSITVTMAQDSFEIDTSQSSLKWKGSNLFKFNEHFGTAKFSSGQILMENDSISGGNFKVDMNTIINTDGKYNEMLVRHLKNEDFFDVKKHPSAYLEIKEVNYIDENQVQINANLTIKSITNPIVYNSAVEHQKGKVIMTAKFIIDRTLWNVNYESKSLLNSLKDDTISDAIEFEATVITDQKK